MEEAIEILAKNYNQSLTNPKLAPYKEIVEKNKKNPLILEYISKQYRPISIREGTFGSYLWGCSQNFYGNVNKNCSVLCADSLNFDLNESTENQTCQYQIWSYDKNLKLITPKISSSRAYIYVPENWEYFKKSDIDILKSKEIQFVSILITKESKHITLIPMTSIENIPISDEDFKIVLKTQKSNKLYYFLLIFLILIIFIFLNIFNKK